MSVKRLGVEKPAANTDTLLTDVLINFFASVIITNLSETETANLTIYVKPNGVVDPSGYAYIIYNFPLEPFNSLETNRFALNPLDEVWVKSSIEDVSFVAEGIPQRDIGLRYTTGLASEAPNDPTPGDLHFATDLDGLLIYTTGFGWRDIQINTGL